LFLEMFLDLLFERSDSSRILSHQNQGQKQDENRRPHVDHVYHELTAAGAPGHNSTVARVDVEASARDTMAANATVGVRDSNRPAAKFRLVSSP
jgi:hypothetical protein